MYCGDSNFRQKHGNQGQFSPVICLIVLNFYSETICQTISYQFVLWLEMR